MESSPYKQVSEALGTNNALQSFTHRQMTAAANALYNYYLLIDLLKLVDPTSFTSPSGLKPLIADLISSSDQDEANVDSVHKAFVNCLMALEAAHKAGSQ